MHTPGTNPSLGTVVDEPPVEEQAPVAPTAATPTEPAVQAKRLPSWDDIEADKRYSGADPKQQSAMRGVYWDKHVAADPRVQGLNADRQASARARFVNAPLAPPPDSLYEQVKKAVGGGVREEATTAEALANVASEAVGGTLAAGMAGVGTLVNAALEGRTDLIPQTYETIRDTLRDFVVFQPQTEEGKAKAVAIGQAASYPFVKADEFLAKAQENLYTTLQPKLGDEEAARVAISLTAGLRGTAIYALTALGGRRRGEATGATPAEPAGTAAPVQGGLPGPPNRPQLEGPSPFNMPGEVRQLVGGPKPPAGLLEGPDIFQMPGGGLTRRPGDPFNVPGPKEPLLLEGPKGAVGGPAVGEVTQPTAPPETTGSPTTGVALPAAPNRPVPTPLMEMSIEQLRQALTTDDLTGLPNRLAYAEVPKKATQAFADLDGLGYVNDNFGHAAGDVLIQAYGQIFKEAGLDAYRAGRGADEFVVQFDNTGAAHKALGQAQERLQNAIIEYTTPDGEVKQFKGLSFSYGVGRTIGDADVALNANKAERASVGLRAKAKGARPPGLEEVAGRSTERRRVPGQAAEAADANAQTAIDTTQGTAPQVPSPGIGLPEPNAPSPASGGAVPLWVQYVDKLRAETPSEVSLVPRTQMDRVTRHMEQERSREGGLGPTDPAIVAVQDGPSLGLGGLEKLADTVKDGPTSPEMDGMGGAVHLYSGLPLDQARAIIKWVQGQVSTRVRVGKDLSALQIGLQPLLSPTFLSRIHPAAEQLVTMNQMLRHRDYYAKVEHGRKDYDNRVKGLSSAEKLTVGQLLDTYFDSREIPVEVLNGRRDITPSVLTAFDGIRHQILEPAWAAHAEAAGGQGPGKVHAYFMRMYERADAVPQDLQDQIIRSFAEENGLDFVDARRVLQGRIPDRGFFGPLSRSRVGEEKPGRVWDLDKVMHFYIAGAARKGYLDQFLPLAKQALAQIEQPRTRDMIQAYVDRQRGLTTGQLTTVLRQNPFLSKAARYEALRQYISKLGIRPVITILNSLQYPLFDGTKAFHAALTERNAGPLRDFVGGVTGLLTERGQELVRRSGVMSGPGAWAPDVKSPLAALDKLAHVTGFFHNAVDRYSRAASYLRNYNAAERSLKGLPEGAIRPADAEMQKQLAGYKGVAETQFFYDVSGNPSSLANPLAANLLRFRQYMLQSLGYLANLKGTELLMFAGVLTALGGPDALPGWRQWYAELRRSHPGAPITKLFAALQGGSLAGMAGVDIGYATGFGFIPGASVDTDIMQKYQDDFWGTVGTEVGGASVRDVVNLYKDATTGYVDLKDPDFKSILGSRSFGAISVTAQQAARALKENEDKYIEYSRRRPGPALSDRDIMLRGFGFTSTDLARRQQEYAQWRVDVDNAITDKMHLEDQYARWRTRLASTGMWTKELADELTEITDKEHAFNRLHRNEVGLRVTQKSLTEAYKMTMRPLPERVAQGRLQRRLLRERLDPYQPAPRQPERPPLAPAPP